MKDKFLLDNLQTTIAVIHKDVNPEMLCHNHGALSPPGCPFSGLNLASVRVLVS